MKTVIIDEYEVVHRGVSEFLANSSFDVVARCRTLPDYSQAVTDELMVDLILTEVSVGGMELSRIFKTIRKQSGSAKVVVFSEFDDPSLIQQAKDLGADGYILKSVTSFEFVSKLQDLQCHGSIWSSDLTEPVSAL